MKFFLRYRRFTIFANLKLNFFCAIITKVHLIFFCPIIMKLLITIVADHYRFLHNPKKTNVAQVCVTSSIFSMFEMFSVFIPV